MEVGTKARSTIVEASRQREYGRDQYLSTVQPLIVHSSCRQNYTRKSSIKSHRKKLTTDSDNTETTGLRPTAMGSRQFDITKDCLICGENADENRKKKGTLKDIDRVCRCETLPFIDKIRKHAEIRGDEIGGKVLCHLATTIDLPAAEARYHNRCCLNFFRPKKPCLGHINEKKKAFSILCDILKDNSECQYSISDLEEIMEEKSMTNLNCIPENILKTSSRSPLVTAWLLHHCQANQLYSHFEEHSVRLFTSHDMMKDFLILCLRNCAWFIQLLR